MFVKNNFYIISGGPGAGKTTLLNGLSAQGFNCVPEVARRIIKEEVGTGGNALPWKDTLKYSERMLSDSISDFIRLSNMDGLYFFDRGIPDTYGYEVLLGRAISDNLKLAVNKYRYNIQVFLLPPWKDIYETDSERKQDFKTAMDTYTVMKKIYLDLNYIPVEVPLVSVSQRVDFVISKLV